MRGEWCYFKSYFTPQQCEIIVKTGLTQPSQPALAGGKEQPDIRRSEIRFLEEKNSMFSWIFDLLWKAARRANHDYFGFDINHLGYLQLAKYKAEDLGEYKAHQDVFWLNDSTGHRKLSCVVQLSEPFTYKGGELELAVSRPASQQEREDMKALGTIIFFPSFIYHAAQQVTQGDRFSLAAWFDGPKWR